MSATALTLSQLSKKYASPAPGAPARHALRPVDLTASGGEIVAIVGPNGSGKSTLLKIVAGLLRPSGGSVTLTVDGTALDTAGARGSVGYVSPDIALYPELSGRENLRFFARARGSRRAEEMVDSALESVGLSGRGDDLLQVYSSGMRQRLKIALATLFSPPVLLFDEPGLALDSQGAGVVEAAIRAASDRGALVLLGTNDSREASLAHRHVRLAAGS